MKALAVSLALTAALACCTSTAPANTEARQGGAVSFGGIDSLPTGRCFATEDVPPQFRTVTEQIEIVPERKDANGVVISRAIFRNQTRQIPVPVPPGQRFETLCPPAYTFELVQSLQRAMRVRGAYFGPINGQFGAPTQAAVRRIQQTQGLNSGLLSMQTARGLGLIAVAMAQ